ncbi:MAG TPA: amylo-alpha-1,6-glucosidase [Syntrophales bacterium]|nr:amylo-alpha-1,6-glucosidase [Syntrophales bacterium]
MKRLAIDESICRHLEKAMALEWLDTNGLGGYASSTILGCNTRKYHGLLVGNLKNPKGRYVLLAWVEDAVAADKEIFLSSAQYPGFFFPGDAFFLSKFRLDNFPMFTYEAEGVRIRKSVMMVAKEDRVLIRYEIRKLAKPGSLRVRPFLAFRGYHGLTKENAFIHKKAEELEEGFKFQPYDGMPPMIMEANVETRFLPSPVWHNNFEYRVEKERGFDWREDLFCPGAFEMPIREGSSVILSAATFSSREKPDEAWAREEARRVGEAARDEGVAEKIKDEEDRVNVRNLISSGRQFHVDSPSGRPAIIAGYHWFGDWGRDTLISLPGLTFLSGRTEEGMAILASIGAYEKDGLLPNFFSDDETGNAYNTVDTSLWYFWAVQQMLMNKGDMGFVKSRLWPVMKRILTGYMDGTAFNVGTDKNGLLHAGDRNTHITWMDATVAGTPVTPRWGYPVEINALWYNAVSFANELCQLFGESSYNLPDLITRIKKSFVDTFWIEEGVYLGDVFRDGVLDHAVRPNQILAVSLPHSPLDAARWKGVVDKVKKHLLTPVGLRTLSPEDREYRPLYEGDGTARDAAYHQGTVWPWLIGHFGEACIKAAEDKALAKRFLVNYLRQFIGRHMKEVGIGCVSEIFDGDPPHRPNGCISQAWSVAELIRLHMLLSNVPDD